MTEERKDSRSGTCVNFANPDKPEMPGHDMPAIVERLFATKNAVIILCPKAWNHTAGKLQKFYNNITI